MEEEEETRLELERDDEGEKVLNGDGEAGAAAARVGHLAVVCDHLMEKR